jgi:hypothetical protein
MTNLGEHRVERKSLPAGRFIVLLLVVVIALMVVFRIVDWLGDVAALVVIVCASLALAAVAWSRQD